MNPATLIRGLFAGAVMVTAHSAETSPPLGANGDSVSRLRFTYASAAAVTPGEKPALEAVTPATLLPKFEVREKPLALGPDDVKTGAALVAEAKARYLDPVYQKTGGQLMAGLEIIANPLGGWHPNEATAMTFYAQDERLRRIKKSNEMIEVYRVQNPAKFKELRELLFDTYQHEPIRRPGAMQRR